MVRKRAKKERVVMTPRKEKNLKLMSDTYERNKIGQIGALKRGRIDFPLQGMSIIAPRTTVASLSVPVPMFKCIYPACNKYFIETSRLYYHVREHQQSLDCPYCSKSNKCMATLIYHVRTHTKEKPYICHVAGCDFSSSTKCNLVAHLKSDIHHAPLKGNDVYPWFKDYLELDIKPYLRNKNKGKHKAPRSKRRRRRKAMHGEEEEAPVPHYLNAEDHSLKMVPITAGHGLGLRKGPLANLPVMLPMANPPQMAMRHPPQYQQVPHRQQIQLAPKKNMNAWKAEGIQTMKPEVADKMMFQMPFVSMLPPAISIRPKGWDQGFPPIAVAEPSPTTAAAISAACALAGVSLGGMESRPNPSTRRQRKMPPRVIVIEDSA